MKKGITIIFRCVYLAIFLAVILLVLFACLNRMRGEISITVNGADYPLKDMECIYIGGEEKDEKLTLRNTKSGLRFKSSGSLYGMYEYSFDVRDKNLDISPKILVFKTNWWKMYRMNIKIDICETKDTWDAKVLFEKNGNTYEETYSDIENNGIEFRYN